MTYELDAFADFALYHCVDLLGGFPGISSSVISRGERALARRHVVAAASSDAVAQHLAELGFQNVLSWPNVAEVSLFAPASKVERHARRVVFAGNLTDNKVDFGLLSDVLAKGVEVHLAGPVAEGGGGGARAVRELVAQGAHFHGLLSPPRLVQLFSECTVGLIPYLRNDYTAGVNPLKVYEYLAAGMMVVSTGLASIDRSTFDVLVASDREQFVDMVLRAGDTRATASRRSRRLKAASEHSWEARGAEIRNLVLRQRGTESESA